MPNIETKEQWEKALLDYFELQRIRNPLPPREELTLAEEFQCRIIGGAFIPWIREYGPRLIQEREVVRVGYDGESDPAMIFISEVPGLIAASQILGPKKRVLQYLSRPEYDSFLGEHPDESLRYHVTYSSYFVKPMEEENLARALDQYPLQPGEEYWLHREETVLGELFVRGGDHLWKWNGNEPSLLEEGFNLWLA